MVNPKNLVILAVQNFEGNPHESKTIEPLLCQMQRNLNYQSKEVVYDRGGRDWSNINGVNISTPKPPLKRNSQYSKLKKRKKFRRRAVRESVIGHLKKEFRMGQNCLNDASSPSINAKLAATGWNLKKLMKKLKKEFLRLYIFRDKFFENFFQQINKHKKLTPIWS